MSPSFRIFVFSLCASLGVAGAAAQTSVGGAVTNFKDTSMLRPPTGAKIAIIEWEDLECPACARAFPIVHAAIAHYNIPIVRYDFIIPGHMWSKDAETYARYMQDTFGMEYATEYRREVFASQFRLANPDDLKQFTTNFLQAHGGKGLPFAMDPKFLKEVEADRDLGDKLGLQETPTIIVVTSKEWIQVRDVMQLYAAIDKAEADLKLAHIDVPQQGSDKAQSASAAAASTQSTDTSSAAPTTPVQPTPAPAAPATTAATQTDQNAPADSSGHLGMYLGIGGAAVVVVGGAVVLMKNRKKSA